LVNKKKEREMNGLDGRASSGALKGVVENHGGN
jgi:hypothetical protein